MSDPLAIPPVPAASAGLMPASPAEVAQSLAYALRYDERGKARAAGLELIAAIAAERLVEHLQRSGFVVLKARTAPAHSAG
ncbi:hypothetical protein GWK16_16290 [Roseomonas sp. JC162]|uniref:Uncharacterized protein n=1 Tax=Neoroseomonas marina TaxID=1232220 RepID=A0A848EFN2_9PROT|nr:hypothetical protein [Neoroseomonas marina]NMJ42806.1 hypothetical protein [Neoroseomonas marina]